MGGLSGGEQMKQSFCNIHFWQPHNHRNNPSEIFHKEQAMGKTPLRKSARSAPKKPVRKEPEPESDDSDGNMNFAGGRGGDSSSDEDEEVFNLGADNDESDDDDDDDENDDDDEVIPQLVTAKLVF